MVFIVAKQYPQFNVLNSPVVYIYFVFIILSTLRLNFWLSFFCGALGAASYFDRSAIFYMNVSMPQTGLKRLSYYSLVLRPDWLPAKYVPV